MAKKNKIEIDVHADDDGTLKKVGVESKKAAKGMEDLGNKSNNARRNMGGAADMTNRGVKSFSKMQQGVGGLVGVYATLAAQVFAVSAAFQFLKSASDVVNLIAGQEALGAVTGVAYKTITASIKEATGGQIAYADAAKAAAIGTAAGLSPEQLNRLGAAAKNVSNALGRDLTDSFNRLVRGITKAEPELLDELGIILRLDDAAQKYADTLGLNKNELTTFQKSQAVANETLSQAEEKFGAINEIMDPSATSLNRFLVSFDDLMNTIKKGAMKGLRPVFDFLAGNTRALTAALSLMALPIIKSLIPSFENWGKKVNKSLEAQREGLKDYRGEIDKTKDAIAMMGRDSAAIGQSSAGVLGSLGKDTTSASKGSGAAFLLGTSDTKAAQNNARKILDNAKAQMKEHNAVLTGYLQGATAQQLAILETNYSQRRILLKKHEAVHGTTWKRMGLHVKFWAQEAKLAVMSVQTALVGFAANIGTYLSKLFSIGMWLSLGAMVGEIFLGWLDKLNPISEESERLRKRIADLTKSNKTLNEELAKMADIQPFLNLSTQVQQLGQAFTSTNIIAKLAELRALQSGPAPELTESEKAIKSLAQMYLDGDDLMRKTLFFTPAVQMQNLPILKEFKTLIRETVKASATKGDNPFKEAEEGTLKLFKNLAALIPRVQEFTDLFEKQGYLTNKQTQELASLGEKWQNYGMGVAKAKDALKVFNDELKNLIGTGLRTDPTAEVRIAGYKAMDLQSQGLGGLLSKQEINTDKKAGLENQLKDEQAIRDSFAQKYGAPSDITGTIGISIDSLMNKKGGEELVKQWKEITKNVSNAANEVDLVTENLEEGKKEITNAQEELLKTARIMTIMNRISGEIAPLMEKRLKLEKAASKMRTLGIKAGGKLANIEANRLKREAKTTKLLEIRKAKEGAFEAASNEYKLKGGALNKQKMEDAENALDLAKHNIELDEDSNKLADKKDKLLKSQVHSMLIMAGIQRQENAMLERFNQLENQRARDEMKTGVAGRTKEDKAYEERQRKIARIGGEAGEIARQRLSINRADQALDDARLNKDEAGVALAEKALEAEIQKLRVLKLQIEKLENFNQLQIQGMRDETADTAKRLGELSLDPRQQAVNEKLGLLDKDATADDKRNAKLAAQDQFDLNLQLEETSALYETIQTSMSGAFEDMITGAKSAKEAFASMAKSMLAELAKIIAKRLMLKALGALGFADGGITPKLKGRSYTVGGVARGPSSGYQATLHGNEAVVPLPSGGAIPVQGTGLGGGTNNVTVNVNVDNNGNASSESQGQGMGQDLGKVVAKAVQEELQYQKRSGGILNPYGAA